MAEDGAEDCKAGGDGHGDEPCAADADVEGSWRRLSIDIHMQQMQMEERSERKLTVAALVKAVARVAVVGEDDDAVAAFLQADSSVDDEAFCAADAQVWMEKDDCFIFGRGVGFALGRGRRRLFGLGRHLGRGIGCVGDVVMRCKRRLGEGALVFSLVFLIGRRVE